MVNVGGRVFFRWGLGFSNNETSKTVKNGNHPPCANPDFKIATKG